MYGRHATLVTPYCLMYMYELYPLPPEQPLLKPWPQLTMFCTVSTGMGVSAYV